MGRRRLGSSRSDDSVSKETSTFFVFSLSFFSLFHRHYEASRINGFLREGTLELTLDRVLRHKLFMASKQSNVFSWLLAFRFGAKQKWQQLGKHIGAVTLLFLDCKRVGVMPQLANSGYAYFYEKHFFGGRGWSLVSKYIGGVVIHLGH